MNTPAFILIAVITLAGPPPAPTLRKLNHAGPCLGIRFYRMNTPAFILIAVITLAGALAAATLRKLIHAALSLVIAFVGVAASFFMLGAEFVGLVQVFVYVGAVAVLIVFTILLTRREVNGVRGINWSGAIVSFAVFCGLLWTIFKTKSLALPAPQIE